MGAKLSSGNGRKNYYSIAYGKLGTKVKEAPETFSEVTEEELKSKVFNVENIDLRNKYVVKKSDSDYNIGVFYDFIDGNITKIEKEKFDKGLSLQITMVDDEGEESIIQTKFYGKYAENILNRLCNVSDIYDTLELWPYSIPGDFETDEGNKMKFYNQGVSIKEKGKKVDMKYTGDTVDDMPPTTRVQNHEGNMVTSRVDRVNFLFDEVMAKFGEQTIEEPPKKATEKDSTPTKPGKTTTTKKATPPPVEDEDDDLPF